VDHTSSKALLPTTAQLDAKSVNKDDKDTKDAPKAAEVNAVGAKLN